jgi:hypothetical protein
VSVRADWGLQGLEAAGDPGEKVDPFGAASLLWMGNETSPDWLFDVTTETEDEELLRLLGLTRRTQNRLMNEGTDCPIRWQTGTSCMACPLSEATNPSSPKCQLCRTSTQEERIETVLAAKQSDGG